MVLLGLLWGFAFREGKDAARGVRAAVWAGVGLLVLATVILGHGNSLA